MTTESNVVLSGVRAPASSSISVLLVEDNPSDVRLIREMLRETPGADLEVANCLADAVSRLGKGGIALVLLDLGLPDSQGLETLMSPLLASPAVPVIALTGLDDDDLALAAVQLGAQDYLVKSTVTPEILRRTVRHAIERKRSEEAMKEQLDELCRWHDVTMGRETRILDLKREVNGLLTQAGKPPRYASAEPDSGDAGVPARMPEHTPRRGTRGR